MRISRHARVRSQQRGMSEFAIQMILQHGKISFAPGGTRKIFLGNKEHSKIVGELKKTIQELDHAKGGTLIFNNDQIITVYKNN